MNNEILKIARAIVNIEDILKIVKKKYKNDNKLIEELEFLLQILKGDSDE